MLQKKSIKLWDVNVEKIVISKLVQAKTNSKSLIGIKFDKAIRPLVLVMPKMSGYVKTFKVKEGDKDENNKLMSFRIDDEKLLKKYKSIWTKIENLKNIELNALRTYGDKVYINFRGLNVSQDDVECESFTVISFDSLLVYENKYYLQVYLDHCAYKIVYKQMTDYLDENAFED